jgi:dipeptide/tripeptide permease
VVAESLDRLWRDQENVVHLFKLLSFAGVKLVTLSEAAVSIVGQSWFTKFALQRFESCLRAYEFTTQPLQVWRVGSFFLHGERRP